LEGAREMAKPPAEVNFPGDKNRRKKIRMRGIKQASKEIQHRLDRNLEELMDDPEIFVPEIRGELDGSFFSKDKMVRRSKNSLKWPRNVTTPDGCASG
jgi:hypothetical protein